MTIDELASWLSKHGDFDSSPWMEWFDRNLCANCEPEEVYVADLGGRKMTCAWCELHHKCKYFQDMAEIPDNEEIIKLWLESEA